MIRTSTFFISALVIGAASAATPSEILKCSAIEDSVKRLECFDGLASSKQIDADSEARESLGDLPSKDNWRTSISQSKIDDSTTVSLATTSKHDVPGRFQGTSTPVLFLRCLENTTAAYIIFDGLFMSDHGSYGDVTFRVDKKKAVTRTLAVSTDHKALGLWRGGRSIPFIKSLFDANTLTVQATPHSESSITFEFDISDLKEAISPLRKACNW